MSDSRFKKAIVISAINFFEGGPLTILIDVLNELSLENYAHYSILFFIHKKDLLPPRNYPPHITFLELPKSRSSYFYRLYYEYVYFYFFSKKQNIMLWLSLHDITPNVKAKKRAVYCHNPTPFYKKSAKDFFTYPNLFISAIFYKYIYQINIHKNDFVIVQPYWIKKEFIRLFNIPPEKIIVATPSPAIKEIPIIKNKKNTDKKVFFFPCIPRPFKNIEVLAEACNILSKKNISNFKLVLTIDGSENKYSKFIFKKYNTIKEIQFIGRQSRQSVEEIYNTCDILLFPSCLETWGLPLTEFKPLKKPIFASKLPYAKETLGDYDKVIFLNPKKPQDWADLMENAINKKDILFEGNKKIEVPKPNANNWKGIFDLFL